jgi:hypothetical protein
MDVDKKCGTCSSCPRVTPICFEFHPHRLEPTQFCTKFAPETFRVARNISSALVPEWLVSFSNCSEFLLRDATSKSVRKEAIYLSLEQNHIKSSLG